MSAPPARRFVGRMRIETWKEGLTLPVAPAYRPETGLTAALGSSLETSAAIVEPGMPLAF